MNNNSLAVPASIIIGAVIIAGAVVYSNGSLVPAPGGGNNQAAIGAGNDGGSVPSEPTSGAAEGIKPIGEGDHMRGSKDASVKIVEFSDTECPFCKRFHETMRAALDEYNGRVAWVYRHFPLDSIHPKSRKEAEATECANELGGNEKFWAYLDKIFEITPSNNGLDLGELPKIAQQIGLNRQKFEQCLNSGKYGKHIQENLDDATNSGGRGTPYSIVIAANGKKFVISGAQPYEAVKQIVDSALAEK